MKWFKFLDVSYSRGCVANIQMARDGSVSAMIKPDHHIMTVFGSGYEGCRPMVALNAHGILSEKFEDPSSEIFLVVTVAPGGIGTNGYDIITDGEKIAYIYNIARKGFFYTHRENDNNILLDKLPDQAIALTKWHAEIIDKMGEMLNEKSAIA